MDFVDDEELYKKIGIYLPTVRRLLSLAIEIVREGMEGNPIGTMFVIGDSKNVLKKSKPLILDLFNRQEVEVHSIHKVETRETIKKLASLDGAFIITGDGIVVSAARYIKPDTEGKVSLGVGTRHVTGAAITAETKSVAIIVSASGTIRIYANGKLMREYKVEMRLRVLDDEYYDQKVENMKLREIPLFNPDINLVIYPKPFFDNRTSEFQFENITDVNYRFHTIKIPTGIENNRADYWFEFV